MTELEKVTADAKQVWLNAGDADGNAEAARFALEHGPNIQRAIEALTLTQEQAEKTARLAALTIARLRAMTPNSEVTRPAAPFAAGPVSEANEG